MESEASSRLNKLYNVMSGPEDTSDKTNVLLEEKTNAPFATRQYQVDLIEVAIRRNSILCLPTGSGKTYISLKVIEHFLASSYGTGKCVVFVAPSVPLVYQQADYFEQHLPPRCTVVRLVGELGVDYFCEFQWKKLMADADVLVMSITLLYNALCATHITWDKISLLVLDECHHATGDHHLVKIMKHYNNAKGSDVEVPRVVGLTATVINSILKHKRLKQAVSDLESRLCCQAVTHPNFEEILKFSTNAKVRIVKLNSPKYSRNDDVCEPIQEIVRLMDTIPSLDAVLDDYVPNGGRLYGRRVSLSERVKGHLEDILQIYEELGPYCAVFACKTKMCEIIKCNKEVEMKYHESGNMEIMLTGLCVCLTYLQWFNDKINSKMVSEYKDKMDATHCDISFIQFCVENFMSEKVNAVLNILEQKSPKVTDKDDAKLCAIIFCRKRLTTKVLNWAIQELSKHSEKFGFLRCNYVTGSSSGNGCMNLEDNRNHSKWQAAVLSDFRKGHINLIVATSVLEEGLDVASCNLIIRFDVVQNYPSYIQSMGRARQRNALFYVLVEEGTYDKEFLKLSSFQTINDELKEQLSARLECHFDERTDFESSNIEHEKYDAVPEFCPGGTWNSPRLPETSVIPTVYRYCALLGASDGYSEVKPVSWHLSVGSGFVAYLRLPCSPIHDVLEGDVKSNLILAKRSVFRKACEELYKAGELDDRLLPKKNDLKSYESTFLQTLAQENNERFNGKDKLGTKQHCELYIKSIPLQLLSDDIEPEQALNLYNICMQYHPLDKFNSASEQYKFNFELHPYNYGFLTKKDLSKMPVFWLRIPTGRIQVKIKKFLSTIKLSAENVAIARKFQKFMAENVYVISIMELLEQSTTDLSLVPIKKGGSIDWSKMNELNNFDHKMYTTVPSHSAIVNLIWDESTYMDAVVVPWYRHMNPTEPKMYCVSEFDKKITSKSNMENGSTEGTYESYYMLKYNTTITQPNLPLLKCNAIGKQRNFLSCQQPSATVGGSAFIFPPEVVNVSPMPASLLYQGQYLMSIIHRMNRLMMAMIVQGEIGQLHSWNVSRDGADNDNFDNMVEDNNNNGAGSEIVMKNGPTKRKLVSSCKSKAEVYGFDFVSPNTYQWGNVDAIMTERAVSEMRNGVRYHSNDNKRQKMFPKMEKIDSAYNALQQSSVQTRYRGLDIKTDFNKQKGPDLFTIMEAFTLANSNDCMNLELLEVLGDAVLKLVVSVHVFSNFATWKEGEMTMLRMQVISNEHLCGVSLRRGFGAILSGSKFKAEEFIPPGFQVPSNLNLAEEKLSKYTVDDKEGTKTLLTHSFVSDKSIADSTEALIGAYYRFGGLDSALRAMKWIGLEGPCSDGTSAPYSKAISFSTPKMEYKPRTGQNPENMIPYLDGLEKILNYKFKEPWLLVEALTHSTYLHNNVTRTYQRLEFLGDAVLDFLITDYIISSTGIKNPGKVTDLRSALVNNVTFGCLSEKYSFHRYLLYNSEKLHSAFSKFSQFQAEQQREIMDPYMLLIEIDGEMAENVEVPKTLGDIFEAIVGAVFSDSGYSLDVTWEVVYRLMNQEIETFSKDVPINCVRQLMEMFPGRVVVRDIDLQNEYDDLKCVEITVNGERKLQERGVGPRKKLAKEAAAKSILKKLALS